MILLFECFPHVPPSNHKATYFAVVRLILGISGNRTTLKTFLSHVGEWCSGSRESRLAEDLMPAS